MFQLTQAVLKQLLSTKNTSPDRLSASERAIVDRICLCTTCEQLWIRRKQKLPERCPYCHSRAWDRPFISALIMREDPTKKTTPTKDPNPPKEATNK